MMRFLNRLVPCLALALAEWAGAGPAQTVVPDGLGVNIHFTNPRPGEL